MGVFAYTLHDFLILGGMTLEKDLEAWVGRRVRKVGGLWLKWVSPGCVGVPDRILITQGGVVAFVEMKQESGRLSKRQQFVCGKLRSLGCRVYVIYNKEQALDMLREVMPDEVYSP